MCLLSHVCSCGCRLVLFNSRTVQCVAASKGFDLEQHLMTWQLAFLRLSSIHCISQPAGVGLCLGSLCSLSSSFQTVLQHKTGQQPASKTELPLGAVPLGAGAEVPSLLNRRGSGQMLPAFLFFLQGLNMADHSGCVQAAFWCSQNSVWRKMFQL